MNHPIGQTSNGITVHVNLIGSQAAQHIARQPQLLGLAKEVIQKISARGPEVIIEYDMGRTIGYDFVIGTNEKHSILYAQIFRETIFTRFVKNGRPLATSKLTLVLHRGPDDDYELHDTWIGHISPPRPGSLKETAESRAYWENHAVVLDTQQLQLKSVTKVCPY